jgi:putative transposase
LCLLDARRAGQGRASAGADGLTAHLDYGRHDRARYGSGNSRNNTIAKTVYAHGMSVRDMLRHLEQVYGTRLSHEMVSPDHGVLEEVRAWQSRPLDPAWAVVFPATIEVKVRDNQVVRNKSAYLAVGTGADGEKHVLGIWLTKTPVNTATAGSAPVLEPGDDRPAQCEEVGSS